MIHRAGRRTPINRPSMTNPSGIPDSSVPHKPLSGLKVVDFTRFLAGPYCAQLLGDLGAEVVKVERPGEGDPTRVQGPPFHHGNGLSYYATNRNKRSITLDMQQEEGQKIARQLCLRADVVVENFRRDVMPRLGLDYESLARENPRLIYASISGFGADGPDADLGAFDLTIQAVGGYMSICGEQDGEPIKLGTSAFDMVAGMSCHSAILAALYQRTSSGVGQKVETSLLEAEVAFLLDAAMGYFLTGQEPRKWGSEHALQVPYKAFKTIDGWAVIGAGFQNLFEGLCNVLGRRDLMLDHRFATPANRVAHRNELYDILDAEIAERSTATLIEALQESKVPCAPVNTIRQVFENRQVLHRGMRQTLHHPEYGDIPSLGAAAKYSSFDVTTGWTAPPRLGEDSEEVLRRWLDMNAAKIDALRASSVI